MSTPCTQAAFLEGHEQRMQAMERLASDLAAQAKATDLKFEVISEQIEQLGKQVTTSIEKLGVRVDALAAQTAEHREYLKELTEERKVSDERKKKWRKVGWGAGLAALAAFMTKFGEQLWSWFVAKVTGP